MEGFIEFEARGTDSFWSDSLEATLVALWDESPETAVWETVQQWGFNVREYLDEIFGPWSLIPWDHLKIGEDEQQQLKASAAGITVKRNKDLIDILVAAAKEHDEEAYGHAVAHLLVQGGYSTGESKPQLHNKIQEKHYTAY